MRRGSIVCYQDFSSHLYCCTGRYVYCFSIFSFRNCYNGYRSRGVCSSRRAGISRRATNVISVLEFPMELAYKANTFDGIITTNTINKATNIIFSVGVRNLFISLIDTISYLMLSIILVFRIMDIKYTDMPIIIT